VKIIDQELADSIRESKKMLKQQSEMLVMMTAKFVFQLEDLKARVEMLEKLMEIK